MKASKVLIMLIAAIIMMFGTMTLTTFAEETKQLTVNDGSWLGSEIPYSADGCNTIGNHSQFIQSADTLTAMKDQVITQMTFPLNDSEGPNGAIFEVRLMETDVTSLVNGFVDTTNATLVYTGTADYNEDWNIVIPFDTTYFYKSGNLVVDFLVITAGEASSNQYCGVKATNASRYQCGTEESVKNVLPLVIFDFKEPTYYLDLESTDVYADKKEIEQNYTFTQTSEEYTDVTKVKLSWKLTDIAATYKSNKTWDPDNLVWVETKTVDDIADQTAEFTLTNYSSTKVTGTVEFKPEDSLKDTLSSATFDDNNGKKIDTVVNYDRTINEDKKNNVPSNTITATLKFNKDKFVDLSQTTSATKYGAYTVTIAAAPYKDSQTISAPSATTENIKSNSITLTAVDAGQGATKYGINTTDAKPENWQDGVEFTDLTPNTTYYFFAKYEGNEDYEAVVSESTQITTKKITYAINTTGLTNVTGGKNNATEIEKDGELTLKFSGSTGYNLPENVTVSGATYSWNKSKGELTISNPTGEVSISMTGIIKTFTVTIYYYDSFGNQDEKVINNVPYGTSYVVSSNTIELYGESVSTSYNISGDQQGVFECWGYSNTVTCDDEVYPSYNWIF